MAHIIGLSCEGRSEKTGPFKFLKTAIFRREWVRGLRAVVYAIFSRI